VRYTFSHSTLGLTQSRKKRNGLGYNQNRDNKEFWARLFGGKVFEKVNRGG